MSEIDRSNLRVLLLQVRADPTTLDEELADFVRFSGLGREQFEVVRVYDRPHFSPDVIDGFDALFVGGSSDVWVTTPEEYPFFDSVTGLLEHCLEQAIPVFASCYGFQHAAIAFGGVVEEGPLEMGTYPISRNGESGTDSLLHDAPSTFGAVSGHKLHVTKLPPGFVLLAKSSLCGCHAFRAENRPFWGFQFHPELTARVLINRITRYRERYFADKPEEEGRGPANLDEVILQVQASPETRYANGLVTRFVDRVLLGSA